MNKGITTSCLKDASLFAVTPQLSSVSDHRMHLSEMLHCLKTCSFVCHIRVNVHFNTLEMIKQDDTLSLVSFSEIIM